MPGLPEAAPARAARILALLLVIYGVFWIQFSMVRPETFGGIDEWLILSLALRGALDVPYANRPLGLLFNLPAGLFPGHLLTASFLWHAHYLVAAGLLLALCLLRVAPHRPDLALLAGVLAATWAPADLLRFDAVYSSAYAGVTAAVSLVFLLLAASGARPILAVLAAGLAFLATRVHEGPLPLLLGAPVLLTAMGHRPGPKRGPMAFYGAVLALASLVALLPLMRSRPETWYQGQLLGVYLDPLGLAQRLGSQFTWHLEALVTTPVRELLRPRPLAAAVLTASGILALGPRETTPVDRRRLALLAAVGLAGAGLAYSCFILAARMAGANRSQFLAAPWIGLFLASAVLLAASLLTGRGRAIAAAALAAGVVAVGTARAARLQETWDAIGAYPRQAGTMSQLVGRAPGLQPRTLVVLMDDRRAWVGTFAFHHALDVVYGRHVAGCVPGAGEQLFYTCSFGPDGVRHEAWRVLGPAWGEYSRTYAFPEVLVVRRDAAGAVTLLDQWPADLPPLPAGAAYAPRLRVLPMAPPRPQRAVLGRLGTPRPGM